MKGGLSKNELLSLAFSAPMWTPEYENEYCSVFFSEVNGIRLTLARYDYYTIKAEFEGVLIGQYQEKTKNHFWDDDRVQRLYAKQYDAMIAREKKRQLNRESEEERVRREAAEKARKKLRE